MGKVFDLVQEGVLCVQCGGLMEDLIQEEVPHLKQGPGYPRTCTACKKIENYYKIKNVRKRKGERNDGWKSDPDTQEYRIS